MAEDRSLYTDIAKLWMAPVWASMGFWWQLPYLDPKETTSSMKKVEKKQEAPKVHKCQNKRDIGPYLWLCVVALFCFVAAEGYMANTNDAKLAARLEQLEHDNKLQQQIITDLGDTLAALDEKLGHKFKYW